MAEYINREAAIQALGDCPMNWTDSEAEVQAVEDWKRYKAALESIPAADVQPVRHGRWEHIGQKRSYRYECSNCHQVAYWIGGKKCGYAYCPNCKAKMDEEEQA